MTATDWDLHPWARKLEPCGLVATCDERDWQKIVDDYRAQGADLHERFAVWVASSTTTTGLASSCSSTPTSTPTMTSPRRWTSTSSPGSVAASS